MIVAFDTETVAFQPGLLAPPLVCVSFAVEGADPWLMDAASGAQRLADYVSEGALIVGHNLAYDTAVTAAYRPDLLPAIFAHYAKGLFADTKVRQELVDIAAGRRQDGGMVMVFNHKTKEWARSDYSLAGLERLYINRDRSEDKHGEDSWRKRYAELAGLPLDQWPEDATRYAKEDAGGTLAVYLAQAAAHPVIATEAEQVRAAFALHLMSVWGIRTDGDAVSALEVKLLAAKKKNDRRLHQAAFFKARRATAVEVSEGKVDFMEEAKVTKAGVTKEPRPMRWAKDMERISGYVTRVYERRLKTKPPLTESGRISTDRDTLSQSGSRLLACLADGGGVDKILQTYLPALKQGTSVPINARFNVLVNSGRTSSSSPNLQNLPSGKRIGGVRETFVPRTGFVFVSCDYATLELRALADRCVLLFGRSRMAEAIKDGKDLHLVMAGQILRIAYEDAVARYKAKEPALKRARDLAKVANFGMGGGLGAASLVEYARASFGVVLTEGEARSLKESWLNAFPEMRSYFQYISERTGMGNATYTDPVTGYVRGGLDYCSFANHLFQGPSAMGGKAALFQLAHECYVDLGTPLFGSRGVAWIHDEWVGELPEGRAHEAAARVSQVMNEQMATVIKNVPITSESALMARWLKAAEPIYVAGRLVPWSEGA